MNWYKLSQAAFQTFNIENKITESFVQAYNNYIQLHKDNPEFQHVFEQKKSLYIGSMDISQLIQPIIQQYGKPKTDIPKTINFFVMSRKHPQAKKHNAFFLVNEGDFIMGKILDQVTQFENPEEFTYSIQHELQHFLKSLYSGQTSSPEKEGKYLSDSWEIQSYALIIAQKAMDDIKELYSFRLELAKPENIPNIKAKISSSKDELTSKFLLPELKKFIDRAGQKIDEEARKQYYLSTVKNFNKLFDQFVSKI